MAPRARSWVSLSYAPGTDLRRISGGVPAVRFEPWPPGEPAFSHRGRVGLVTGFAGGFILARPGCIPLELWVEGRREPIRRLVPFGVLHCSG